MIGTPCICKCRALNTKILRNIQEHILRNRLTPKQSPGKPVRCHRESQTISANFVFELSSASSLIGRNSILVAHRNQPVGLKSLSTPKKLYLIFPSPCFTSLTTFFSFISVSKGTDWLFTTLVTLSINLFF